MRELEIEILEMEKLGMDRVSIFSIRPDPIVSGSKFLISSRNLVSRQPESGA